MLGLAQLQGKHYGNAIFPACSQSSQTHILLHAKVQVLVSLQDQNFV
jgi:hypothetical protein